MTKLRCPARDRVLAWASFVTPLTVSLSANFTWGWLSHSPTLIVAGLVTPLLLVLAVERWRAMPVVVENWLWWVRAIAMGGVVLVVASWSWVHTTSLLLGQFPAPGLLEVALCVAAPGAVDGLAVLSVLALDAPPSQGAATSRTSADEPSPETDTPGSPTPADAAALATQVAAVTDSFGHRDTVTAEPLSPDESPRETPAAPVVSSPARRARRQPLRAVPSKTGQRTRRELVEAGHKVGVTRRASENVEQLRVRVEAAERDREAATA